MDYKSFVLIFTAIFLTTITAYVIGVHIGIKHVCEISQDHYRGEKNPKIDSLRESELRSKIPSHYFGL